MTFDEWYLKKYGESFNDMHQFTGNTYGNVIRALTSAVREYVSEMVKS